MPEFTRYAIYHLPEDSTLAAFGADWLGWCINTGAHRATRNSGELGDISANARRYGFHATITPPFALADETHETALTDDLAQFASRTAALDLQGLACVALGRFFALVPTGDTSGISALAFDCVRSLDRHRRQMSPEELVRRDKPSLSPAQRDLLHRWGYPHVGPEFRYHLTLTDRVPSARKSDVSDLLRASLPALPSPYPVTSLALVGEGSDGFFRHIRSFNLTG